MQLSDLDKVTLLVMGRARTPDLTLVLFPLHDAVSDPFLGAVQTHNLDNSLDQMDRAKPKTTLLIPLHKIAMPHSRSNPTQGLIDTPSPFFPEGES